MKNKSIRALANAKASKNKPGPWDDLARAAGSGVGALKTAAGMAKDIVVNAPKDVASAAGNAIKMGRDMGYEAAKPIAKALTAGSGRSANILNTYPSKKRSYPVPVDYIDQVSGSSGSGTTGSFSGRNTKYTPGKSKVVGGGEGPIRGSRMYTGGGNLGKMTFSRNPMERYDTMYRGRR